MSRYSAPSSDDYYGEQDGPRVRCLTLGCEGYCETPELSSWCYDCRLMELYAELRDKRRMQRIVSPKDAA